ncbi:hypothetical protein D910_12544 [Dendroctonus ponderosae]
MDFTDLNVFDSDDDMDDLFLRRQPKVFRSRTNYFEEFDDLEFCKRFGLQKGTVNLFMSQIENRIKAPTSKTSDCNIVTQEHSQAVIVATTVLHSLAIQERDGDPRSEVDDKNALEENVPQFNSDFSDQENNRMRMMVINNHFSNLV